MSRISGFSSPLLLGFEDIQLMLERISKAQGEGYPPYNIERLKDEGDAFKLRITVAVAGFKQEDLEIVLEGNELYISGKRKENDCQSEFLHKGIAMRAFRRIFVLAEGIEVTSADLKHGLLSIALERPIPNKIIQKINIRDHEG